MKQTLQQVYTNKQFNYENFKIEPFVINRVLSMNNKLISQTDFMSKYLFRCDRKILCALFHYLIPKQNHISWRKFIKPLVDSKQEFSFLLDSFKKYYNWSEKDLKYNLPILLKQFEDKTKLRYFFRFFGVEKKYYKKYDIPLKIEKKWF